MEIKIFLGLNGTILSMTSYFLVLINLLLNYLFCPWFGWTIIKMAIIIRAQCDYLFIFTLSDQQSKIQRYSITIMYDTKKENLCLKHD